MSRPRPPRRDLSQDDGNPTSALQAAYGQLMSIKDPEEMMDAAIQVVKPLVGRGVSEENYQKFLNDLQDSSRKGLPGVIGYITNYILRGSGLGIGESAESIASFIMEDINEFRNLTPQQQHLKMLIESNTNLSVVLLEYCQHRDRQIIESEGSNQIAGSPVPPRAGYLDPAEDGRHKYFAMKFDRYIEAIKKVFEEHPEHAERLTVMLKDLMSGIDVQKGGETSRAIQNSRYARRLADRPASFASQGIDPHGMS